MINMYAGYTVHSERESSEEDLLEEAKVRGRPTDKVGKEGKYR
jgi:hypothetical protein